MEPLWLRLAYEEMRRGVREVPGSTSNPRVLQYHNSTTLKATDDAVAWCAAFVGWCLEQAGVTHTRSARARSYLAWGAKVSVVHPPIGAVVILARGSGRQPGPETLDAQGHVGFFFGHGPPGELYLLGGNQSNAVCLERYSIHRVLGIRWPGEE